MTAKKTKETKPLYRFWCSWQAPDNLPKSSMKKKWPAGMYGWISGYGDDYTIWCAIVVAQTAAQARGIVHSCYGKYSEHIEDRWEPEQKAPTWTPGDRFPLPKGALLP